MKASCYVIMVKVALLIMRFIICLGICVNSISNKCVLLRKGQARLFVKIGFSYYMRGNCVRYGADQELGPNKRRAASEAARLSVK